MFLLLIPVALALVLVSVLGMAGIGPLTDSRRADRSGILGGVGSAVGLVIGVALLAISALATVGMTGLSSGDGETAPRAELRSSPTVPTAPAPATPTSGATAAPTAPLGTPVPGARVTLEALEDATFPTSYEVADGLAADTVLTVHVLGFEPFAAAVAEQCAPATSRRCGNLIPVQFGEQGEARFQYLVSDDFLTSERVDGGCRAGADPCTIDVRSIDDRTGQETRASIQTVFGDELEPAGRIIVSRSNELAVAGEQIEVEVRDYPPGSEVTAMLCAAPDAYGPRCGAPGPVATLAVGDDGTGRATLVVEPGPVGTERAPCSRGDDCGISVVSDDVFARAPVVPITFAPPPGAAYDSVRLAVGLALAALLLVVAAWLLVRTDWDPVGELAAPEIDDAEYADLDAIIAALPPEEDDELASVP